MMREEKADKLERATMPIGMAAQPFDYYCVLDFEATCQEGSRINPQEIIEPNSPRRSVHNESG